MYHANKLVLINVAIFVEIYLGKKFATQRIINAIILHKFFLIHFTISWDCFKFLLQVVNLPLIETFIKRSRPTAKYFVTHSYVTLNLN